MNTEEKKGKCQLTVKNFQKVPNFFFVKVKEDKITLKESTGLINS
jgi:hypothetical protein